MISVRVVLGVSLLGLTWLAVAAPAQHPTEMPVSSAPVRDLDEVTNDPHLHERGMLQRMQHPQLGDVVLPNTPIRLHGAVEPPLEPSPALDPTHSPTTVPIGAAAAATLRPLAKAGSAAGTRTRTGSVLMNMPSIPSTPVSGAERPENVAPNTTSAGSGSRT